MTARNRMTMRCTIQRDTASGTDAYGHPVTPSFTTLAEDVSLYTWSQSQVEAYDGNKIAVVSTLKAIMPKDTDITPKDRITAIVDRRGQSLFAETWHVEAVERRPDHKALTLIAVAS